MSWLRHWKVILSLLAIFVAGTVTGAFLTLRVVRSYANRSALGTLMPLAPQWPNTALKNYEKRLKLTPEQVEKFKPMFEQAGKDLATTRTNVATDVLVTLRRLNAQVEAELTPEQKAELEKLREENRNRFGKNAKRRTLEKKE